MRTVRYGNTRWATPFVELLMAVVELLADDADGEEGPPLSSSGCVDIPVEIVEAVEHRVVC